MLVSAQTALGKHKKYVMWNAGIGPLPKFYGKLLFHAKFHWNRAIGCRVMAQKRCLKWRPSAVLNLKKNSYLDIWLWLSSKCAVVYQISSKSDDFSSRYGDLTICNIAGVRDLEFSEFRVFVTWPLLTYVLLCFSASLCKISLILDKQFLNGGRPPS